MFVKEYRAVLPVADLTTMSVSVANYKSNIGILSLSSKLIYNLFSKEDGSKSEDISNIKVYLWIPLIPNSGRDDHLVGIGTS